MDIDKKNKIDSFFQQNLYDLEMEVPAGIFTKIDQHIEEKKRRRLLGYWYAMAASVSLLIALGTGYFMGKKSFVPEWPEKSITAKAIENQIIATPKEIHTELNNSEFTIFNNKANIVHNKVDKEEDKMLLSDLLQENQTDKEIIRITSSESTSINNTSLNTSFHFSRSQIGFKISVNKEVAVIREKKVSNNAEFAQQQLQNALNKEFRTFNWEKKVKIESSAPFSQSNDMAYVAPTGTSYAMSSVKNTAINADLSPMNSLLVNYMADNKLVSATVRVASNTIVVSSLAPYQYQRTSVKVTYSEIPVTGQYQLVRHKFILSLSGGVSALVPNFANMYNIGSLEGENMTTHNRNYKGILGVSFQLPIFQNLNFSMEPRIHYPLGTESNDASMFRVYSGLKYSF